MRQYIGAREKERKKCLKQRVVKKTETTLGFKKGDFYPRNRCKSTARGGGQKEAAGLQGLKGVAVRRRDPKVPVPRSSARQPCCGRWLWVPEEALPPAGRDLLKEVLAVPRLLASRSPPLYCHHSFIDTCHQGSGPEAESLRPLPAF